MHSAKHFEGLSRNAATLLSTKVADSMLAHSAEEKLLASHTCVSLTKLSDKEKAGLQYIGGSVLHKLYNKHAIVKKLLETEQACLYLRLGS